MPVRRQLIFFPILFAIYPALNLYAHNAGSVEPSKGLLPVALIAAFMTLLYFVVSRLIRQSTSAALLTTAIGVFAFYYGYLFNGLRDLTQLAPEYFRMVHTIFLTLWTFALIVLCLNLYRRRRAMPTLNSYLNFLSLVMVALPLVTLTPGLLAANASVTPGAARTGTPLGTSIALAAPPDVYYIILDGYGRDDVLASYLDYDNSPFLRELEGRGFYVARESCANYPFTFLSMPSSLNMDYLDTIAPGAVSTAMLPSLIRENTVLRTFNELGYTTIHFATVWEPTRTSPHSDIVYRYNEIEPYYQLLKDTTVIAPISVPWVNHDGRLLNWLTLEEQRAVTTETLRQLKLIAAVPEPTFTFTHLIIPHPPYLFDRNGNLPEFMIGHSGLVYLGDWGELEGYIDQVIYINNEIIKVIDAILRQSETPPIIIVQGDHGPGRAEPPGPQIQLPILNAYYLPEGGDHYLYPDISPVNSFRLVFDLYFGAHRGLLEQTYRFAMFEDPLNLSEEACVPREG